MKTKKIIALMMTLVMAIGFSLFLTACDETSEGQEGEQATVAEEESTEPPAEETTDVTQTVEEYVNLAGEYQDEVSQRASATVIANTEGQNLNITVMWSGSATTASQWTMNAVKEGNKLVYSDCACTELIYSDDTDEEGTGDEEVGGGAEETLVYEDGSGYFEITDDGKLLWTGAADEQCQECVFTKITE